MLLNRWAVDQHRPWLDGDMTGARENHMAETDTGAATGDAPALKDAAAWHPTTDEHQSLLALLGKGGGRLDGLSEIFGQDVLPFVVKAQCLELLRLGRVVEDLSATSRTVDAMLGGVLGVALPAPPADEDPKARSMIEDIYRVGAHMRARIQMLEEENTSLRAHLDALADQLATGRTVRLADLDDEPVVISAGVNTRS